MMKRSTVALFLFAVSCAGGPSPELVIQSAKEKVFPAVVFIKPVHDRLVQLQDEVADREITTLEGLKEAYDEAVKREKGKRRLLMKLIRYGYPRYVALDYEKDPDDSEE